jgi:DNA-binding NarL/FixJ family response regulator
MTSQVAQPRHTDTHTDQNNHATSHAHPDWCVRFSTPPQEGAAHQPNHHERPSTEGSFVVETIEVLALMAEGRSNQGIADRFVITLRAVEKYVSSIFSKRDLPTTGSDSKRVLAVLLYLRG